MSALAKAAERNLRFLLQPIQDLLDDPAMTNLYINGVGAGQCFVSRGRGIERLTLPFTFCELEDIAINAAALRQQDIAEDVPVVDTVFPGGQRVNIVRPPAVPEGTMSFSIRRPSARTMRPAELEGQGVFAHVAHGKTRTKRESNTERLLELYRAMRWREFIELAIACKLNLVWSGSVDAGKTHSMRSFTHAIPPDWRIVTVEDTPELIDLPCPNTVHLLYSKGMQSVARVSSTDLVEAALRMGIQGLLVQELRDEAAFSYVKGLESGHWGMTTTHAEISRGRVRPDFRAGEAAPGRNAPAGAGHPGDAAQEHPHHRALRQGRRRRSGPASRRGNLLGTGVARGGRAERRGGVEGDRNEGKIRCAGGVPRPRGRLLG